MVVDRKENMWYLLDFSIAMDHHIKEKEEQSIGKYMDLAAKVRIQFRVKTVIVPILLGVLESVLRKTTKNAQKLEIRDVIGSLQTAVL